MKRGWNRGKSTKVKERRVWARATRVIAPPPRYLRKKPAIKELLDADDEPRGEKEDPD